MKDIEVLGERWQVYVQTRIRQFDTRSREALETFWWDCEEMLQRELWSKKDLGPEVEAIAWRKKFLEGA